MAHVNSPSSAAFCERNFSYDSGELAVNRTGSCVALALSSALGMPYKHATKWVLKHGGGRAKQFNGRTYVAGAATAANIKNYLTKLGRKDGRLILTPRMAFLGAVTGVEHDVLDTNCKLSTFAKNHPTGRYLVLVAGHAVALVNGHIFDNNAPYGAKNYNVRFAIELGTKK